MFVHHIVTLRAALSPLARHPRFCLAQLSMSVLQTGYDPPGLTWLHDYASPRPCPKRELGVRLSAMPGPGAHDDLIDRVGTCSRSHARRVR